MVWVNQDTDMLDSLKFRRFTLALILLAIPFFFIGGPSSVSLDAYRRFWDLGHSLFFALVAVNLVWWGIIKTPRQFSIAFVMVVLLSLAIEKLQSWVGRDASWLDVLANLSGFVLGYSLTQAFELKTFLLRLASLLGLMPGLWSFFKSAMVVAVAWQQFPVLLNGDSFWEQKAWGGDIPLQKISQQSGYRIVFPGKAFVSSDMMGFVQSWNGYQNLVFEVNNLGAKELLLTLRISDKQHELSDQEYSDRFNRRLLLLPGENRIEVSLEEIANSPAKRKMDMDEIYLLMLFLPEDGESQKIHLNKLYLQ